MVAGRLLRCPDAWRASGLSAEHGACDTGPKGRDRRRDGTVDGGTRRGQWLAGGSRRIGRCGRTLRSSPFLLRWRLLLPSSLRWPPRSIRSALADHDRCLDAPSPRGHEEQRHVRALSSNARKSAYALWWPWRASLPCALCRLLSPMRTHNQKVMRQPALLPISSSL